MAASPQQFLQFAADNWDLLVDLFHSQEPRNDREILGLVERRARPSDLQPATVLHRLKEQGIIESAPDSASHYELTTFVRDFVSHLLRRQHLTSAAVVQGYLNELSDLTNELEDSLQRYRRSTVRRALAEISTSLEHIRRDSHGNRESVTSEIVSLKTIRKDISSAERWQSVNRIMEHYLKPLSSLIEPKQAMDDFLERLERVLNSGNERLEADHEMREAFVRTTARLERTKQQARTEHSECLREITPLYTSLRRDSLLLRGAGIALQRLYREGISGLPLAGFSIFNLRSRGLIAERALASYMALLRNFKAESPPAIVMNPPVQPPIVINRAALIRKMKDCEPISDLLAWICHQYKEASPSEILRAYGILLEINAQRLQVADAVPRRYIVGLLELEAWPLAQITVSK